MALEADEVGSLVHRAPAMTLTALGSVPLADPARLDVGAAAQDLCHGLLSGLQCRRVAGVLTSGTRHLWTLVLRGQVPHAGFCAMFRQPPVCGLPSYEKAGEANATCPVTVSRAPLGLCRPCM